MIWQNWPKGDCSTVRKAANWVNLAERRVLLHQALYRCVGIYKNVS